MAGSKFRLSGSLRQAAGKASDGLEIEQEKTRRSEIEGAYKQMGEQQKMLVEMIGLAGNVLGVIKSAIELEATRVEWAGRVEVAEEALKKALTELQDTRERTAVRHRELDQVEQVLAVFQQIFEMRKGQIEAGKLPPDRLQVELRDLQSVAGQMANALKAYKG